jgi:hypothetical protein
MNKQINKQEGHEGPELLTRHNCFSVLEFFIKFEHRICLNNDLRKRHNLGHLSFSLNSANQINMSKLDKRLHENATDKVW